MSFNLGAIGQGALSALGSIGGGLFSGSGVPQETKMQRTQRKLIDQLIASLGGDGKYSDLYATDENAFNKSFVEPAQAMFRNKIAPNIQQQYIASGQQGGTGLDDALTRAGVDLDAMLNQQMYQFNQDALNRKQSTINSILGQGAGAQQQPSFGQNAMSAFGGFLSSNAAQDITRNLFNNNNYNPNARKGFENNSFGGAS